MNTIYPQAQVRAIIREQFPDFDIRELTPAGAGNDCEVFLVNGGYIFKFPKHDTAATNLFREICALEDIHDHLPLPVPRIEFHGRPSEGVPRCFSGYRKLDGDVLTPALLQSLPSVRRERAAADLAHFLTALHSVPITGSRRGLLVDMRNRYENDYRKLIPLLRAELNAAQLGAVDRLFRDILDDEELFRYEPRLVHNDFSSNHILYDTGGGRVCGVIDFGDVAVSDPDNDFLHILEAGEEYGMEFGLMVLRHYRHENIDRVLKKFALQTRYWPVGQILYGTAYGFLDWYREGLEGIRRLSE